MTQLILLSLSISLATGAHWGQASSMKSTGVNVDTCAEQAPCSYGKKLFDRIDFRGEGFIDSRIIVPAADANGDAIVDFYEWFSKLKSYVKAAFDVLDQNQDGSILDEAREGNILNSISYRFFEKLLNQLFDLFDSNNDGAISLEDESFREVFWDMFYRTRHGKMTLSEYFGVDLITLPAPIYNFYEKLDRDKDERLTQAEALDFISKLFTVINNDPDNDTVINNDQKNDTNSDCKIDANKVLKLLEVLEVPWDHQLAVKLVLDQELTLVSYLLKNLVERADRDKDGEVTIEEILAFDDFEFIESVFPVLPELASPGRSVWGYLMGWSGTWNEREALVAMWLTVLQSLMENPIFSSAGETALYCSSAP